MLINNGKYPPLISQFTILMQIQTYKITKKNLTNIIKRERLDECMNACMNVCCSFTQKLPTGRILMTLYIIMLFTRIDQNSIKAIIYMSKKLVLNKIQWTYIHTFGVWQACDNYWNWLLEQVNVGSTCDKRTEQLTI